MSWEMIILSGRSSIPYQNENLFMRRKNDFRPDTIVKDELFKAHIEPYYEVLGIFEDHKCMVDLWRSKGLFVFDVNQSGLDY